MGVAKDAYDIATDSVDRFSRKGKNSKSSLSLGLAEMATVLDAARGRFERREIPRREAHALAYLANHSADLAARFREKDADLAEIFDKKLGSIAELMQKADYFVKEQTAKGMRFIVQPAKETDDPLFHFHAEEAIRLACEEMERVAGQLSAYSIKYRDSASPPRA